MPPIAVMARNRFYLLDTPNEGSTAMKRVGKLTLGTMGLLFLGVVLAAGDAFAQTAKDFVGTWTLVSAATEQGGNKTDTFGPNPKGILIVDANGRYVIAFSRADLPKVASNNRTTATAEENKAIVGGSLAHFGTLSVNAADKTFTFKIETATFPNWSGTEQKRPFTISGDQLRYTAAAASGGGTATVVWKRAK
jgi:hypothetical protein